MNEFTKIGPGHLVRTELLEWIDGKPHLLRKAKIKDLTLDRYSYGEWECANEWVAYAVTEAKFLADISDGQKLTVSYKSIKSNHEVHEDEIVRFSQFREDLTINGEKVDDEKLLAFVNLVIKQSQEFTVDFTDPVTQSTPQHSNECQGITPAKPSTAKVLPKDLFVILSEDTERKDFDYVLNQVPGNGMTNKELMKYFNSFEVDCAAVYIDDDGERLIEGGIWPQEADETLADSVVFTVYGRAEGVWAKTDPTWPLHDCASEDEANALCRKLSNMVSHKQESVFAGFAF